MKYLSYVATEGGPILVGDIGTFSNWHGIDTNDYDDLISEMDINDKLITIDKMQAICWDPEGGGTTYIYEFSDKIFLIKGFEKDLSRYCLSPLNYEEKIGSISVHTGLAVVYATEPATMINEVIPNNSGHIIHEDIAFENSVFVKKGLKERFNCYSDYIYDNDKTLYKAKRLILEKVEK